MKFFLRPCISNGSNPVGYATIYHVLAPANGAEHDNQIGMLWYEGRVMKKTF